MGCAQSKRRGPRHPFTHSSKERTKFHSRKESAMPSQKSSSTITKESNFSPDHIGANSTLKSCGDKNLSSHWSPPKALDCDVTDESINTIAEAKIESDANCLCSHELKTVGLVDTKSKDYYLMNESQIKQVNAKHIVENTTTKCEMKNSIVEDLSSNFIGSTCDLTEDMLIEEGGRFPSEEVVDQSHHSSPLSQSKSSLFQSLESVDDVTIQYGVSADDSDSESNCSVLEAFENDDHMMETNTECCQIAESESCGLSTETEIESQTGNGLTNGNSSAILKEESCSDCSCHRRLRRAYSCPCLPSFIYDSLVNVESVAANLIYLSMNSNVQNTSTSPPKYTNTAVDAQNNNLVVPQQGEDRCISMPLGKRPCFSTVSSTDDKYSLPVPNDNDVSCNANNTNYPVSVSVNIGLASDNQNNNSDSDDSSSTSSARSAKSSSSKGSSSASPLKMSIPFSFPIIKEIELPSDKSEDEDDNVSSTCSTSSNEHYWKPAKARKESILGSLKKKISGSNNQLFQSTSTLSGGSKKESPKSRRKSAKKTAKSQRQRRSSLPCNDFIPHLHDLDEYEPRCESLPEQSNRSSALALTSSQLQHLQKIAEQAKEGSSGGESDENDDVTKNNGVITKSSAPSRKPAARRNSLRKMLFQRRPSLPSNQFATQQRLSDIYDVDARCESLPEEPTLPIESETNGPITKALPLRRRMSLSIMQSVNSIANKLKTKLSNEDLSKKSPSASSSNESLADDKMSKIRSRGRRMSLPVVSRKNNNAKNSSKRMNSSIAENKSLDTSFDGDRVTSLPVMSRGRSRRHSIATQSIIPRGSDQSETSIKKKSKSTMKDNIFTNNLVSLECSDSVDSLDTVITFLSMEDDVSYLSDASD